MAELSFDPSAHRYTLDGRVLPSVTQILEPYEDWSGINPEVLAAAMERGTRVHAAAELMLDGFIGPHDSGDDIAPYLVQFDRFLAESGFVPELSEARVYSTKLGYAGTLDLYGMFGKRTCTLVDIKTGSVPRTAGPQTAAYARALKETKGYSTKFRYALLLRPEGYKLVPLADPNDDQVFLAAITMHNWSNKK